MTVFKGYMKIMKCNKGLILLYLVVFMGITVMFQAAGGNDPATSYRAQSVKIAVVDEDKGSLAEELKNYLGQRHQVSVMENDRARMQEDLFYRDVEYIIHIPEHFFETCVVDAQKLQVTKVPGSYTAFYVDQQINSFLNNARVYDAAGFTEEETAAALKEAQPAEVELLDSGQTLEELPAYGFYFRYLPYLFLSVLCYVMGNVIAAFRKGDLPKRMRASAVSARRQSIEGLLASAAMAAGLWAVAVIGAFIFYGKRLVESGGLLYFLLNSLVLVLVVLSISYLVGTLVHGKDMVNALNGVVNVLSLGMCFLCGVFVSLDVMSKGVKKVAQFLPVYRYEVANELIVEFGSVTGEAQRTVFVGIGMQAVFAAALVCVTLAAAKWKRV